MQGHIDTFVPTDNGLGLKLQARPLNDSYYDPEDGIPPKLPPKPAYTTPITHSHTQKPQSHKHKDRLSSASKDPSMTKGRVSARIIGMSRSLSSGLPEDILQQLLRQEAEAKESHRLLQIAAEKVEILQQRAVTAEEARKQETARGMRIAQTALGAQEQVEKARQDAEVYRLKLEYMEREIQRQQHLMRTVESERDHAEKAAAKARDVARQLNDERMIALARQEGRKAGFAEGIQQGRQLAIDGQRGEHLPGTPLTAFIEEIRRTPRPGLITPEELERGEREAAAAAEEKRRAREAAEAARREQEAVAEIARREREAVAEIARREREAAEAARREQEAIEDAHRQFEAAEAARREQEAIEETRRQLEAAEAARRDQEAMEEVRRRLEVAEAAKKELEEAKRQAEEELRREAERRREAEALEAERKREAERQLELQRMREELEQQKRILAEQERTRALEMEVLRLREQEKERQLEMERERIEQERNEERRRREEREAELARERDRVRDLEREREASSVSSSSHRGSQTQPPRRLEYLAMPEPPAARGPSNANANANAAQTPVSAATSSPLPLRIPPPTIRPPQQFQPHPNPHARPQARRTSLSSQETSHSSSTSIRNFDILSFPSGGMDRRSHLSDIPEVSSHSGASDAGRSPLPSEILRDPNLRHDMEDIERWRRSTSGSEDTPTEPATPPSPRGLDSRSPYGANSVQGSVSSGTIGIDVVPPSGPGSPIHIDPAQDRAFLSPMSRPAELAPDPQPQPRRPEPPSEPPGGPVIPDMLDNDGDGLGHLMNFGFGTPAGFIPMAIRTSSEASSSSERGSLNERRLGGTGARIYGPPAPSSGARYAQAQPNNGQTPRMQIYGPPAGSQTPRKTPVQIYGPPAGSQTPRQNPIQIYGPPAGSQTPRQPTMQIYAPPAGTQTPRQPATQIYAPPAGSQTPRQPATQIYAPPAGSQTPRHPATQIYAPPAGSQTPRQPTTQIYASSPANSGSGSGTRIYAAPNQTPRTSAINIYGPPASTPASSGPAVAGGATPQQRTSIYGPPASPHTAPVIPPSPQRQSQIYNMNAAAPVIPSSSPNAYPYPVGTATPGSRSIGLPGSGGLGMRTPGGSYTAPLPAVGGATPASRTSALPAEIRGSATPRIIPVTLDEDDEDMMEADLQTRLNTQANASGRGGTTLPIPPMY
ncbi:hypothetical protein H0H92_002011 [Tricholoma furcatifolium]|nr:hypothetical protein H0H92_002011 [Tricholoma furcatifolium]